MKSRAFQCDRIVVSAMKRRFLTASDGRWGWSMGPFPPNEPSTRGCGKIGIRTPTMVFSCWFSFRSTSKGYPLLTKRNKPNPKKQMYNIGSYLVGQMAGGVPNGLEFHGGRARANCQYPRDKVWGSLDFSKLKLINLLVGSRYQKRIPSW